MGYTTDFRGSFELNKPLDDATAKLIDGLNNSRRMKRDLTKLGMSKAEAKKYGIEGEFYYLATSNDHGQEHDASILDYNEPPKTQPGLWLQWVYNKEKNCIEWNCGEKFYYYVEWLRYLIKRVLKSNYVLNGSVEFQGEEQADQGVIVVIDNVVRVEMYDVSDDSAEESD